MSLDRLCELSTGDDKWERLPQFKEKVKEELKITEDVVSLIETNNITETNDFNI